MKNHSSCVGEEAPAISAADAAEQHSYLVSHLSPVMVICGHYGVGKSNFAINLALQAAKAGAQVTLVDMDVVNPYFRSGEYDGLLSEHGIETIAPVFGGAGTNLDSPSISGAVGPSVTRAYFEYSKAQESGDSVSVPPRVVVIDAGGDDAGAFALGRFAEDIARGPHQVLYVVNRFRNLTQNPDEAVALAGEIVEACHLAVTGVVGNSHMQQETDASHVLQGARFARQVADALAVPVVANTEPEWLVAPCDECVSPNSRPSRSFIVRRYVNPPWEL